MKVSELITEEKMSNWKDGDVITISAGTGAGKSHFIKNKLYKKAKRENKRILMLIHRINCVDQFQMEIEEDGKTDVIDIKTYQSIEAIYKGNNRREFNFKQYDYYIMDEWHFYMQDSKFNKYTDLSLEAILKETEKVKIFMSATGDHMKEFLNHFKKQKTIDYEIPKDYSFIEELRFFREDKTLEDFIQEAIEENRKSIFFIESPEKAYNLHKKYKEHTLFNCGKSNKKNYYRYVDKEKIRNMLKNERFEELILITTSVMDAGVNIYDKELQHIVVDMKDTGTLLQCIGRKRMIDSEDKIYLHVKVRGNNQLGGFISQAKKKIKKADHFTEEGVNSYVKEFYREDDSTGMIYDENNAFGLPTKKRNDLMYYKYKTDIIELENMLKLGKDGYCVYLSQLLGNKKYKFIKEKDTGDMLENYLESIIGKPLYKEEQKELTQMFIENGLQARTLGINTLNGNLKDSKMSFLIIPKRTSYREEGKVRTVRYWEVIRDVDVKCMP